MKLKTLLIGLTALVAFSTKTKAQSDSSYFFTLKEAQEFAVENYYLSKNAERDIEVAQKKIWETTAMGLPQVSGGIDYTYIPEVPEASLGGITTLGSSLEPGDPVLGSHIGNEVYIGFTPGDPIKLGVENDVSYNVMLTQLLFSGEYIVGLQASKTFKQFTEEAYEKTIIQIKELIANSYYSLVILEDNKKLLKGTVDNLKALYNETDQSAQIGLLEQTDADQLAINVKRTENQLNSVCRQIEFMYKMLKYQLGLKIDADLTLKDSISNLVNSNLVEIASIGSFDLEGHIDYKMMDTQEKLNELSLKREKSMYLPSVSSFYKYSDKLEKAAFDFTVKHMIGVSVAVPIFNSGMKNAKVGQAKIELEKSQLQKNQEAQALIMTAQQALFDYTTALESYQNELENFNLSKKILDHTTKKYSQGMVSSMDLTLANNQYLESQLTMSTATLELLNAKVALDKAYNKL